MSDIFADKAKKFMFLGDYDSELLRSMMMGNVWGFIEPKILYEKAECVVNPRGFMVALAFCSYSKAYDKQMDPSGLSEDEMIEVITEKGCREQNKSTDICIDFEFIHLECFSGTTDSRLTDDYQGLMKILEVMGLEEEIDLFQRILLIDERHEDLYRPPY